MKKQLQKKHKVMLGVGSGILAATAVAAPLAITLTKKETINPNNMDEVYGVDATAYENMKSDLDNDYLAKLQAEGLTEEAIAKAMAEKDENVNDINGFVKQMHSNGITDNIYTTATKMLRNYAINKLGVDLVRKSRANWNEVENMYNGMRSSFATYMDAHFFDKKVEAKILADSKASYKRIMDEAQAKYANDILSGVMKAKTQLLSCFDTVNAQISRYAAFVRLNEFMSNYTFAFREDAKSFTSVTDEDANRMDTLIAAGELQEGKAISVETMNKIFVCYNNETRQPVSFDTNMLPGYKLVPTFKGQKSDGITNTHSIQIDWSAVSVNYAETKDAAAATSHLFDANDSTVLEQISHPEHFKSVDDFFKLTDEHVKLTDYDMLASSKYESDMLKQTYFNANTNIQLVWDDADACYDGFMYANQTSTEEQTLTLRQLAKTNVHITDGHRNVLLKDVFKSVDQEGYEPKDMIEKFVANCDVIDTVKLSKGVGEQMNVTNSFAAYYQNQANWKDNLHQKAIGSYSFAKGVEANGYTISAEFFTDVNNAFNVEHRNTTILTDKIYAKILKDAKPVDYAVIGLSIFTGVFWTWFALELFSCFIVWLTSEDAAIKTQAAAKMTFWGVLTAITTAGLIADATLGTLYQKKLTDPLQGYADRAKDFDAEEAAKDVKQKIADDTVHFALADEHGKIDSKEFAKKLAKYRKMKTQEQKELFLTYRDFETGYGATFFKLAREKDIDPIKFQKDFSGWDDTKRLYTALVSGINVILADVALAYSVVATEAKTQKDVQAAAETASVAETAEVATTTATQTSFLGRLWRWICSWFGR